MKKITTLLYLLVLLLCPLFIVAQQTGTGSFSASDNHEVDSIDLSTLTPTITIPVLSKKGAIPFSYNLELTSYCFVTVVNLSSRLDCTNPVGTPNSISLLGMGAGYNLSVQGLQTCFTYSQFYVADAGPITVLSEGGGGGASGTQHPVGLGNSLAGC